MQGIFITVEGIDGSGKSTVANFLAEHLLKRGLPICITSEPGGTEIGQHIRRLLMNFPERTALTELFLFLADRAEHVQQVILPALKRGEIVICDRFIDSTIAYQAFGVK